MIVVTGGSSKIFAIIGVTYPDGSIVTCTNGTKSFAAKTTDGKWIVRIPFADTWTVTCTDGNHTASESVVITEGDVKVVNLYYAPDALVILSSQDGLASGYSGAEGASVDGNTVKVFNAGYIAPAIDMTRYSTLTITGRTASMPAVGYEGKVFVDADAPNYYADYSHNFAKSHLFGLTEEAYAFDVSDLNGYYYIGECTGGSVFVFSSIVLS